MFCPNCGTSVRDGASFCPSCGSPLSIQQGGQQAAPPQPSNQGYDPYAQQANQGYDPYAQQNQSYDSYAQQNQSYDAYAQQANQTYDPYAQQQASSSVGGGPVRNDRDIITYVLLTIVTCGIYGYWYIYQLAMDANTMCVDDGDETPGLLMYILLSIVTCGLYAIYWEYKLANRLSAYAPRYGVTIQESGSEVLMWHLIGALICGLGTFVGTNILLQITNQLANAYNNYYGYTYTRQ